MELPSEQDVALERGLAALEDDARDQANRTTEILEEHSTRQASAQDAATGTPTDPHEQNEPGAAGGPPRAVFWWAKGTDVEIALATRRLTYFVEWLVEVEDLPRSVVPTCWLKHPPLVQELWALMCLHEPLHEPKQPNGPITFRINLQQTRARILELGIGHTCSDRHEARMDESDRTRDRRATYPDPHQRFAWSWPPPASSETEPE